MSGARPSSHALDQALGGGAVVGEVLSPAALAAGETDDYDPTSFADDVGTLRLTPDSTGSTLTGLVDGVAQREIRLVNLSATAALVLAHNSSASAAGNRFLNPNNADIEVRPEGSLTLWYDGTSAAWRSQEVWA